jgi:hypothetical protein
MKYFITFGAGGQNYYDAGNRLINQSRNLNVFEKLILYTDKDLKNDNEFWDKHSTFINNNPRGYGYWLWKPYIIKKTMEMMDDDDILLYLDSGCEIDIRKKDQILKYFDIVKTEHIIGTNTGCIEEHWTKKDLFLKLNMLDDKILSSEQHQGGILLINVNSKTRAFINEWYELGCDYHNIDDSPSIAQNSNVFREHRHDQSIYSLLFKKYNYSSKYLLSDSIEVLRNRTGISILKNNRVKPHNLTIILTSTVRVNFKKNAVHQRNKKERIETYLKSVLQWLNKTNFNIILVENSGYKFKELNNEKIIYKKRFEVITFKESELKDAEYLINNNSKGASEIFAINYAFNNSKILKSPVSINKLIDYTNGKLVKPTNFIIKITARFFINELAEYLSKFDLDEYDCLTQFNRDRCEMVGSHYDNFKHVFGLNLIDNNNKYNGHIEYIWKLRTSKYSNILRCKEFKISATKRGGVNGIFTTI